MVKPLYCVFKFSINVQNGNLITLQVPTSMQYWINNIDVILLLHHCDSSLVITVGDGVATFLCHLMHRRT